IPDYFQEHDPQRWMALMAENPLGALITVHAGLPVVNHLPLLCEQESSGGLRLCGHMARANPQWQQLATGETATVLFQGPHAYVSPSWYGSPGVPTWNYAVVHLVGKGRLIEDELETEALVERITAIYEAREPVPWQPQLSGERRTKLLGMIVGFEIRVDKIEAKFKLSQNRPVEDQQAVVNHLTAAGTPQSMAVAALMRPRLKG
ncbi:MAG: FMN-binding negative transcriptional regulator, partial [Halothiobacillaceae bacterium]